MTAKQALRIFEKYNPESAIIRCPNGRSPIRKMLDTYAKAAVNLYGIIPTTELVEIFNRQNIERTNTDEVFILLLPLVLKNKWYCFYKDYIVHYWAIDNFDYAEFWLHEQSGKPRFIPGKDEFLKFENQYYTDETQQSYWQKLYKFLCKEWPDNYKKYRLLNELEYLSKFNFGLKEINKLLEKNGFIFSDEKQAQAFFDLLMEAHNNTRLWSNKGFSPSELFKNMESRKPKNASPEIVIQERINVGQNEPCPCGSGKKYKKCCRLIEEAQTAQLSRSECALFYETWYGLMGFINNRKKIIKANIKPVYPNPISDEQIFNVREALWKNPKLINDYLAAQELPKEKVELLKSWHDHHKKGMFFLVDYKPSYAIAIGPNEQKEDRLYGIKGISRSLADAMQRELPISFETVLLPFKGMIIYDSYMSSMPIGFAEGAKQMFQRMYKNALEHGIVTSLE